MNQNELNDRIRFLVQSPYNTQEFMNLASFPDHWEAIDKEITLPRDVNFSALQREDQECGRIYRLYE